MTNKIDPIFLIKQKNTNLFLYVFENPHTGEEEAEFRDIEINAMITSVMGLTDDIFDDEYDFQLTSFKDEKSAKEFLDYVKVNPYTVEINLKDAEIVKLNMIANFERV